MAAASTTATPQPPPFLTGGGELGRLLSEFDWSKTDLGPIATWPHSLRTAVGMVLLSPVPIVMLWGEDGVMIYNDAYSVFAGGRHPQLLGSKVREGWPEVADFNDNVMRVVLAGGTLAYRNQELTLYRHGHAEQVWMDLDYSPILDESGKPGGVMAIVVETTQRVLAQRRNVAESERLRQMFEQAPGLMALLHGLDHVFELANEAYLKVIGRREVIGKSIRDVLPEIIDQGFLAMLDEVYRTGERYIGRGVSILLERVRGRPLEEVFIDFVYQPVTDNSGAVTGIFVQGSDVTERSRGETALRASEARQALMLHLLQGQRETNDPDAMMAAAAEALGRHLRANRVGFFEVGEDEVHVSKASWTDGRLRPLPGSWPARLVGSRHLAAIRKGRTLHSDDIEREPSLADAGLGGTGARAVIGTPIVRGGQWVAGLYVNQAHVRAWTGEEIQLVRDVADLTWDAVERARAVRSRLESEEQLRLATEAAEVGLWDVDLVSDSLYWQPRVKAMFGISADVPVSMADFYARLHPEDRARVTAAFEAALDPAIRALYDVEYRTVGKEDGVVRWVAAKGRALFDEQDRCRRVIGTAIDITYRKRTESALRELNETLERRVTERTAERDSVWRNSRDLVAILDRDLLIRAVNPAWEAILGRRPDDAIGHSILQFIGVEDGPRSQSALTSAVSGLHLTGFENRLRHADGSLRWLSWRTSVEGEVLYAYGRDVTSEKQRDAELAKAQDALRQAQKMEAVGQLTGGIAHDFNNLLQGIAGNLELIHRYPEDRERIARWSGAAAQAVQRGTKLTGQLLAFSRAQRMDAKPLIVSGLIRDMAEMLTRTLGPLVKISFDLESADTAVLSDQTQLEMAILNLAINARDAMPKGGELAIATHRRSLIGDPELEPGDYLEICVSDTGVGMEADIAAKAFDPFFTTKQSGKGTGLGLSQVYGVARQAGGTARIESRVGSGTTVRLLLRCTDLPVARDRSVEAVAAGPAAHHATVLVIDDDDDVRQFLADSLESMGFAVETAVDGNAGLAALESRAPDVMLVDFAMPGLNGAEVARAAHAKWPLLPIIFASGYAETAAIEAVAAPGTRMLRKPFGLGELERALNEVLQRGPQKLRGSEAAIR